jgi:hypothetical protein
MRSGDRRQQGQAGDEQPERGADKGEAREVGEARQAQDRKAQPVREARRAAVLDWALAESRLDDLEVEDAGKAVAAAVAQTDPELEGQQGQDRPEPADDGDDRSDADDGLVETGGPSVDDVHVVVGMRGAESAGHWVGRNLRARSTMVATMCEHEVAEGGPSRRGGVVASIRR